MRKTGITGEVIKMYENAGLDVNTIYAKSQLLLCSYRRICWSVQNDAYYLMDESCHYGEDYTAALAYLMEFAPDVQKEKFEYRIQNLMESEHWIQLIDLAIERVRTFYKRGDLYAELLSKNYLTGVVYRVDEIIESLGLERSVYYNRRQEAVLLFGSSAGQGGIRRISTGGPSRLRRARAPSARRSRRTESCPRP